MNIEAKKIGIACAQVYWESGRAFNQPEISLARQYAVAAARAVTGREDADRITVEAFDSWLGELLSRKSGR